MIVHWQIVTGCAMAGPGCVNCKSAIRASSDLAYHPSRAGLAVDGKWTGEARFNTAWLRHPLELAPGAEVAIATHSDLFREDVPDDWLDDIFAVVRQTPQHSYQALTKRPARALGYLRSRPPIGNLFLGTSIEDQPRAVDRLPPLLAAPVRGRFIVAFPLIGPIDLIAALGPHYRRGAVSLLAAGDEPERPAPRAWIDDLLMQGRKLGCQVAEFQPDMQTVMQAINGWPEPIHSEL